MPADKRAWAESCQIQHLWRPKFSLRLRVRYDAQTMFPCGVRRGNEDGYVQHLKLKLELGILSLETSSAVRRRMVCTNKFSKKHSGPLLPSACATARRFPSSETLLAARNEIFYHFHRDPSPPRLLSAGRCYQEVPVG